MKRKATLQMHQLLVNLTAPYWALGLLYSIHHICRTSPKYVFYLGDKSNLLLPEVTFKWKASGSKSEATTSQNEMYTNKDL